MTMTVPSVTAPPMAAPTLLSAAEVAHRLGVKPATVYAYVSRGLLERHPASGHRHSLFDSGAVERLAAGARRPNRSGALEVVVETRVTALDPAGRLYFRGHDSTDLARFRAFEDVLALLWDAERPVLLTLEPDDQALVTAVLSACAAHGGAGQVGGAGQEAGAGQVGGAGQEGGATGRAAALDRIPLAICALATRAPGAGDRGREAVRRSGARILAGALEAVCFRTAGARAGDHAAAARLWRALCAGARDKGPAAGRAVASINTALVLMVDHELAASTLAARVAASTWADPYRVVQAGLGALSGPLHGMASAAAEAMLAEVRSPELARAVLERHAAAGPVPGFGHRVYRDRDPRADHLLERAALVAIDQSRADTVRMVLEAGAALGLPAPNADFGLAALCHALGLRRGAPALLFTLARIGGMIAHALEEYPHPLRFRPRATYVGPQPRR